MKFLNFRYAAYIAIAVAVIGFIIISKTNRPPIVPVPEIHHYQVTPGDIFYFRPDGQFVLLERGKRDAVAASPSGNFQAMAYPDKVTLSRRVGDMMENQSFAMINSPVQALAFSTDGTLLAGGGVEGRVTVWGLDGTMRYQFEEPGPVLSLSFSPDGKKLATGLKPHSFAIPDTVRVRTLDGQTMEGFGRAAAQAISFSTTGILAAGFKDGTIRVDKKEWLSPSEVTTLDLSPDGKFLVSGHTDKIIRIWISETGALRHIFPPATPFNPLFPRSLEKVAFDGNGRLLGAAFSDGDMRVWDVSTIVAQK